MTTKDTFVFSWKEGAENKRDIEMKLEALHLRLDALMEASKIKGVPVLKSLLELSSDPKDLMHLSKVLERVSTFLPDLVKLEEQKQLLDLSLKEKEWLLATFGDFEKDIEDIQRFVDSSSD